MRIAEFLERLGQVAPADKAADWDPVGLQLGDPQAEASRVAVCHEINHEIATALAEDPADLVVTYHPLLFEPTTRVVAGAGPVGRAFSLLASGVAVAVVHTSFDASSGGAADALASRIGLEEVQPFAPSRSIPAVKIVTFVPESQVEIVRQAMASAGAGVIGNYTQCSFRAAGIGSFLGGEGASPAVGEAGQLIEEEEARLEMVAPASRMEAAVTALVAAHPYEEPAFDVYEVQATSFPGRIGQLADSISLGELAREVGRRLGTSPVRYSGSKAESITRVGVVPGAGSSFIEAAQSSRADALLTGDVSHHRAVSAADRGLAIIDPGHAASERPGAARLAEIAREIVPETRDLTGISTDPWSWASDG